MSNNKANIANFFDRFDKRFEQVPHIISETSIAHFQERFKEKDWEGVPWPDYKKPKPGQSRSDLLRRSGRLFRSIQEKEANQHRVVITAGDSQSVQYARVHNEGLRVRGVRYVKPYTHNNLFGKGKRVSIKGHTRKVDFKMPRRRFIGIGPTLLRKNRDRLVKYMNQP